MSRLSVFNSPLLLGFDHFERMLDRASKASAEGYPPYNLEHPQLLARCLNSLSLMFMPNCGSGIRLRSMPLKPTSSTSK